MSVKIDILIIPVKSLSNIADVQFRSGHNHIADYTCAVVLSKNETFLAFKANSLRATVWHNLFLLNVLTALKDFRFSLRECLRTHKNFTKYQYFYLNYRKFCIKSYVLDVC